ncbi:MAG: hypothetical protein WD266_02975, partial [Balneolales bacterium]
MNINKPSPALTDQRLERRKVVVLLSQAPVAISAGVVAALITMVLFWRNADPLILGSWFTLYLGMFAFRYYHIQHFNKLADEQRDYTKALTMHLVSSVVAGILWSGIAIYLLVTVDFYNSIIIVLVLSGLAAGAVATNAVKLAAYFAFALPASLPVGFFMLWQDSAQMNFFALIIFIFIAFISFSAYKLNKLVIESLSYQFENLQLLRELQQEKSQVTRLYSNMEFDLARRKKTEEQLKKEKEKAEELA